MGFFNSSASVLALATESPKGKGTLNTNILYVIAPLAGVTKDTVRKIVNASIHADNFQWNGAVLSPDGKLSAFSLDPLQQQQALLRAIDGKIKAQSRSRWPIFEEQAYLALRSQPGRHVILMLTNPDNEYRSESKHDFKEDRTLEVLSSLDITQIYRLTRPVPLRAIIPMGDASTLHEDIGPNDHGPEQLLQVQRASQQQQALAFEQMRWQSTGGRTETSLDKLLKDIIDDAAGTY